MCFDRQSEDLSSWLCADRIEKGFSSGPVRCNILAVLVESLNHPGDNLLCEARIVRL